MKRQECDTEKPLGSDAMLDLLAFAAHPAGICKDISTFIDEIKPLLCNDEQDRFLKARREWVLFFASYDLDRHIQYVSVAVSGAGVPRGGGACSRGRQQPQRRHPQTPVPVAAAQAAGAARRGRGRRATGQAGASEGRSRR